MSADPSHDAEHAESDDAFAACRTVAETRGPTKVLFGVSGMILAAAVAWLVAHHYAVWAVIVIVVPVLFFDCLIEVNLEKRQIWRRHISSGIGHRRKNPDFLGPFNLRRRSWGYLAMGTLLPLSIYHSTQQWPTLRAAEWAHHYLRLPYDFPRTWGFWVVMAVAVLGYTAVFRRGEARQWQDYLRFNSILKLQGDLVAVPVSFVAVLYAAAVALCTDWSRLLSDESSASLNAAVLAVAPAVLWGILGPVDLVRLKGKFWCSIRREDLHIQARPDGTAYDPPIASVLSPAQYRNRRSQPRRDVGYPEPG